jgi:O-antigen/teichoic acid export membrane protein
VQIKRPLLIFFVQAIGAALCAVVSLLAIPRFGMAGAAMATTITYCGVIAFKSLYFRHKTGIGLREQWIVTPADFSPLLQRLKWSARSSS